MVERSTLILTSFAWRTNDTSRLKDLIRGAGAKLTRKGRSRNWTLLVDARQAIYLRKAIEESGQSSWQWVAKILASEGICFSSSELKQFAIQNSPITVSKLMSLTDCTMLEARKIIDELEWD